MDNVKELKHNEDESKNNFPKAKPVHRRSVYSLLGDSLQATEEKVFIDGKEIGFCNDIDFKIETPEANIPDFTHMEPITIEFEMQDTVNFYALAKRLLKLPRKLKKKTYGTVKAKRKLRKLINSGLPVTEKHFKRAGLKISIMPANFT